MKSAMNDKAHEEIRAAVRDHYGSVATGTAKEESAAPAVDAGGCCAPTCCGGGTIPSSSLKVGYSPEDVSSAPDGADLGLGCGNPQAIAALKPGEIVLDLGAGAGFDAFLAARQVGSSGRVIGVDMTPAMLEKARHNAAKAGVNNVEFRLGEIEHLPVADASVDVIMSNCVINLSPDKPAVFAEAFRVLKIGGRIAVSDVVALEPLPDALAKSVAAHSGCIAGAAGIGALKAMLEAAGFTGIRITVNKKSGEFIRDWLPGSGAESYVASAMIEATKRR
jgi:SAM-dependent methyltransferase